MALDACLLVACMILVVSSAPLDDDDAVLATRTLLAAAVFDGRVMPPPPGIDGHLLFRVRRVYKGWHGGQLPRRRPATAAERLILVGCGSSPELDGGGGRSTDCRLDSAAAVGRGRYLVFARSFHAVVVGTGRRRAGGGTPVGVYRTSVPLVPATARARRVVARFSNLGFGQSVSAAARFSPLNYLCRR